MTPGPSRRPPGDQRRRAHVRLAVFAALGALGLVSGGVLVFTTDSHGPAGAALGLGAIALGAAATTLAKHDLPPPDETEERHAPGSPACLGCSRDGVSPARRRLLVGGPIAAVAGLAAGTVWLRGRYDAGEALASTPWRRGDVLVTIDGRQVRFGDLDTGALLTVWPEHAIGVADAQAVLLRLDPRRLGARAREDEWAPEGHVAYSKLCTHMGCPVGLFQQDPDVLVCPCHQAVFDVFDGARPVRGPARRPLPQLPLMIGDDGLLRASDGFSDAVGAGWWRRPR